MNRIIKTREEARIENEIENLTNRILVNIRLQKLHQDYKEDAKAQKCKKDIEKYCDEISILQTDLQLIA